MNKFNNFFNKFFGKKTEQPKKPINQLPQPDDAFIESIMGSLKLMKELSENNGDPSVTLGPPDRIEYSERDGLYFRDLVWIQNGGKGEIHSQEMSDVPFDKEYLKVKETKPETLEDRLADALKNEDYEAAASLRDEMNKK